MTIFDAFWPSSTPNLHPGKNRRGNIYLFACAVDRFFDARLASLHFFKARLEYMANDSTEDRSVRDHARRVQPEINTFITFTKIIRHLFKLIPISYIIIWLLPKPASKIMKNHIRFLGLAGLFYGGALTIKKTFNL